MLGSENIEQLCRKIDIMPTADEKFRSFLTKKMHEDREKFFDGIIKCPLCRNKEIYIAENDLQVNVHNFLYI